MFLYYKYVQWRSKHGQLFCSVLLFKVLRGVFFLIVIRILLLKNIIKGVASAKSSPLVFLSTRPLLVRLTSSAHPASASASASAPAGCCRRQMHCLLCGRHFVPFGNKQPPPRQPPREGRLFSPRLPRLLAAPTTDFCLPGGGGIYCYVSSYIVDFRGRNMLHARRRGCCVYSGMLFFLFFFFKALRIYAVF